VGKRKRVWRPWAPPANRSLSFWSWSPPSWWGQGGGCLN
jgi:hypothetical protein